LWLTEAWSGCEGNREAKNCVEVHLDGEEHWNCTRPDYTGTWYHSPKPILFLAQKRCLGRAEGVAREQALDLPKADDYSTQSSH